MVKFYDILHGFHANRGKGTVIMELNMAQELVSIYQNPLLLVLLDMSKTYYTLYHRRILQTLEGNGAGQQMRGLLEEILGEPGIGYQEEWLSWVIFQGKP